MKLYIKNMICTCCKMVVSDELLKLGLHCTMVKLGEAEIVENISDWQRALFRTALLKADLDLLEDKKDVLTEKIKSIIIDCIRSSTEPLPIKFSAFLSQQLNYDYTYLANLFSDTQGMSIERFFISHKIERVKELLVYDEFSLSEIADKLNYSSVAHLCAQFKKVTGVTSTAFKRLHHINRTMPEDVATTKITSPQKMKWHLTILTP